MNLVAEGWLFLMVWFGWASRRKGQTVETAVYFAAAAVCGVLIELLHHV